MRVTAFRAALFARSWRRSRCRRRTRPSGFARRHVLDGTGKVLRNATIVVQGSKITSIETGQRGRRDIQPRAADGRCPGMIDVHAHVGWHFDKDGRYAARPGTPAQEILYSAENAYVTLMAGFTTIQSPGQANDVELREAIARGVLAGPAHPDVDPPDQRAQRHAGTRFARRSASSRPTAPTSSRSSRRRASATAASRR